AAQGITAHDSTATFTVAPKAGLNAGTYTATVTVSNNNINSNNQFGVSFKVDKANPKATDLVYELKDTIYNGKPYSVTVTVKPDLIGFDTIIAIKYNGSTALPITVGQYDVTADIAAGQNYNAITDLPLGKFEIKKATPSPNHFDFDLGPINILGTDGTRHGITTPTLKSPYEGMGDITVKYDYDVLRPMGLGSFLVTLNITEGKNFVAIDSLVLGYFVINSLPSYSVVREVHLPDVDGVNTNKAPGRHFINHGSPFEFIIYASTATAAHAPVVTTNRPDDETKVIVTLNPDGNYSVAILDVTETIVIAIDVSGVDAIIGADAATVWSSGGALYITASRPGQAAVYTAAGVRVKTFTLAAGETVVDTTLAAGFYIVELEGQNSKVLISR
ncbi:MAG: MBG domain-containing protein, partial [Tannerella sp.]|nr:MBG domain-containing protein [Tannerella sp.]